MNRETLPRVLLVEDDPTSRAYLSDALGAVPVHVDEAADAASAMALSAAGHDLWLIDAHLPDASGADLLHALRRMYAATPALCHTADPDPRGHEALRGRGFAEVLAKPLPPGTLRAAVLRHLRPGHPAAVAEPPPAWDDAAAARALAGEPAHVEALRALFLAELPRARDTIVGAITAGRPDQAGDELHRLVASCGFVGAGRLMQSVRALRLDAGDPAALDAFRRSVEQLLAGQGEPR